MVTRSVPTKGHYEFDSVEQLIVTLAGGTSTYGITVGGLPIDLRFDDRGFDTTVVFFHAAITKAIKRYPVFSGTSFSADLKANRLFVSDPSLYVDPRIKLGWYAGNVKQPKLQGELTQVISRFVRPGNKLIFFGASGGGFASLYYSAQFPGSIAVPVNPQTSIGSYVPVIVDRYLDYAWDRLRIDELPVCTDVREIYRDPPENSVIYVQNTGDAEHMDNHFTPFTDVLPKKNTVAPMLVNVGKGHVPPSRDQLARILTDVIDD